MFHLCWKKKTVNGLSCVSNQTLVHSKCSWPSPAPPNYPLLGLSRLSFGPCSLQWTWLCCLFTPFMSADPAILLLPFKCVHFGQRWKASGVGGTRGLKSLNEGRQATLLSSLFWSCVRGWRILMLFDTLLCVYVCVRTCVRAWVRVCQWGWGPCACA